MSKSTTLLHINEDNQTSRFRMQPNCWRALKGTGQERFSSLPREAADIGRDGGQTLKVMKLHVESGTARLMAL